MKIIGKLRSWWRGPDADPATLAEAKKIRQDMTRQRNDLRTGPPNATHRGGKSSW